MSEQHTNLEVIAPTIEEAIEKGLADLGLTADEVDVEVLDQGSKGLFGLGSRQARVRLTVRSAIAKTGTLEPEMISGVAKIESSRGENEFESIESFEPEPDRFEEVVSTGFVDEKQELTLQVAGDVVKDLLQKMKVHGQVSVHYLEPEDEHSKSTVWVDVRGNDLSILIGPRAETLNALQYIAGLIASKELGKTIPLTVDVEGFRARRILQLRQLAQRMADQAVKTGRRQLLEPMPASERRIIHIALRNNPLVATESIGEEPRRKVTINPK
jgi:spoIIIJ-associated protein